MANEHPKHAGPGEHAGHDRHDHGRDHAGHDHAAHAGHDHDHDHADHDHAGHDHGHAHAHGHGHGHSPVHAPANFGAAFAIGITLNTGFVVIEAIYGVLAHSVALVADAGHNLSDVLGLVAAWTATQLVKHPPKGRFSYGFRGSSILAALFNAIFLLITVGAIAWESIQRLLTPAPVAATTVMIVAAIGIGVNGITAWLFASGRKDDLNIRGAFMHMLSDALTSLGVVVAGLVIMLTGWTWLDPLTSLVLVAIIAMGTWSLLYDSVCMSLQATPLGIDPAKVEAFLRSRPGVSDLHDLHIWPMSTTETALTAHLLMPGGHPDDTTLASFTRELRKRFGVGHATLQIETDPTVPCELEPDHVV